MQDTATLATIAPLSTADLLVLFHSAASEAYAEMKEEQDKQDTFAVFNGETVQVLEFEATEVLISHKCGEEEYVNFNQLDFLG
jgi:hypothetical protein